MSFKAIDLQFAVHKNDEAGIKQNQLMQKPRQDSTLLENQAMQSTDIDRQRTGKLEESHRSDMKDQRKEKQSQMSKSKTKGPMDSAVTEHDHQPEHPYKGHHIDFSL
ncbi:hypothetical protein A8709_19640 [Paenibacillus pectinilyticus]|uniref:Uncharacterized protein n=1 Tax=Paenibacillus pectinilyticus TaxID=512399 RepID=A0A1C1A096_9BACL|nr:hypothetical protein [Paenibacillus pectinilyticus]OCT13790.1 hypothetical protein A8709_19640 [Paenibacillus pectinilyticus]